MATKRTSISVTTSFQSQVAKLHKDWESVQSAYENLAAKQIKFAERIKALWDLAKSLDLKQASDAHQNYVRQELQEIIKTDNASILSRWVKIGGQADKLLPLANMLPPQRDALYETAKVVEDEESLLRKWVKTGQIGPESTVREVKALASGKGQTKKTTKGSKKKHDPALVHVQLGFRKNYGDVGKILRHLIESEDVVQVKSQTAFAESIKELLGKDGYEKIAKKFV